jgi:hypothetical protein
MSGDAHPFNNINTRSVIKYFFLPGKAHKKIHAILTEISGVHPPSHATVKNLLAQFKRCELLQMFCTSSWTTQNSDQPGDYCSNSRTNLGRPADFGLMNS